ncbi:unnamed protein product [Schistosoma mattheei]|uniref:Polycystin cation channel PKD1/PKD2 domain-containing protein n=1 Tax=Schistosoma mattheei TaxID=31246 RepID=A0A3P7Z9M1_9TREM|nr:unnamed protein product [Schistosoma mattheei]
MTYLMGIGALLVWIGILYYVGFSYDNSLLIRTISRSIPGLLRFCVCALILFFAFSLCGWVVLGPYNLKFRTFMSTVECLYSLINGDDMFVTFTIINQNAPIGIYLFSRLFLYLFITLFIYVVLNLFNQGFPTPLGGSFISINSVESSDIRFSSSRFRKQYPPPREGSEWDFTSSGCIHVAM